MSNSRKESSINHQKFNFIPFLSAGIAGALELILIHPVDTITKRIQNSKQRLYTKGQSLTEVKNGLGQTIFRGNKGFTSKVETLYKGGTWAGLHKIFARTYKFGFQPMAEAFVETNFGKQIKYVVGDSHSHSLYKIIGSGLIGLGESAFIPLDTLKSMYQNGEARPMMKVIATENINLFKGGYWAALRNVPGSMILFGGSEAVKTCLFNIDSTTKATFAQNIFANTAGALASSFLTNPIDLIKTRIQCSSGRTSGVSLAVKTLSEEGLRAFTKGGLLRGFANTLRFTLLKSFSEQFPAFLSSRAEKQKSEEIPEVKQTRRMG